MYKIQNSINPLGEVGQQNAVIRIADGAVIPLDTANTDYTAFLLWISEGNTPLPADEPTAT
jgi:hypothetical protein